MFKNYYTTQMSTNNKQLQRRFIKMRSQSGSLSKIMALVMTAAIIIIIGYATIVIAAIGSDGLEHWNKNEIYYRDGVEFLVNIRNKNVPTYIKKDIAGDDGNIKVTISRYQIRDLTGYVYDKSSIKLKGNKGSIKLTSAGHTLGFTKTKPFIKNGRYVDYSPDNPDIKKYKYQTTMDFNDKRGNKNKYIRVNFAIDENKKIQTAYIRFLKADKNGDKTNKLFDIMQADSSLSYTGNFEIDYIKDLTPKYNYFGLVSPPYFTVYEDNYKNKAAQGVDIRVLKATTEKVIIKTDIALPKVKEIKIYIFNEKGDLVGYNHKDSFAVKKEYVLTPAKDYLKDKDGNITEIGYISESQFIKGKKYRVCIVLQDKDFRTIYRYQEYITIL